MADPLDRPQRSLVYPQCDVAYVVWLAQDMVGYYPDEPGVRLLLRPWILVLTQRRNRDAFVCQVSGVGPRRAGRALANCSNWATSAKWISVRGVRMRVDPSLTCQKGWSPGALLYTHDST